LARLPEVDGVSREADGEGVADAGGILAVEERIDEGVEFIEGGEQGECLLHGSQVFAEVDRRLPAELPGIGFYEGVLDSPASQGIA
jgi:hypothetical protein